MQPLITEPSPESEAKLRIGSALFEAAEREAARRGCQQVLLLTHSFQAPSFYERHGYVRHATIADYPLGHAEHIYVKRLANRSVP